MTDARGSKIRELQDEIATHLRTAESFLIGFRPRIEDVRYRMRTIEELMDSLEAVENGAPL